MENKAFEKDVEDVKVERQWKRWHLNKFNSDDNCKRQGSRQCPTDHTNEIKNGS